MFFFVGHIIALFQGVNWSYLDGRLRKILRSRISHAEVLYRKHFHQPPHLPFVDDEILASDAKSVLEKKIKRCFASIDHYQTRDENYETTRNGFAKIEFTLADNYAAIDAKPKPKPRQGRKKKRKSDDRPVVVERFKFGLTVDHGLYAAESQRLWRIAFREYRNLIEACKAAQYFHEELPVAPPTNYARLSLIWPGISSEKARKFFLWCASLECFLLECQMGVRITDSDPEHDSPINS